MLNAKRVPVERSLRNHGQFNSMCDGMAHRVPNRAQHESRSRWGRIQVRAFRAAIKKFNQSD
ncbi:MAG: hypothetical protein ACI8P0_002850 [Planctomycetaceae bacterium]|jgi:hypothetical protein